MNERGPVQTKWGFVAKVRLMPERRRKNPVRKKRERERKREGKPVGQEKEWMGERSFLPVEG